MTIKENRAEPRCRLLTSRRYDDTSLAGVKRTVGAVIMHMQEDVSLLNECGALI